MSECKRSYINISNQMSVLDRISVCVKSDVSVKNHACSRSDINTSKPNFSVRLDIIVSIIVRV